MVFDKSFCVRQISVVEDYGIMLIRGGSSTHKDSHRIHVFKLNEFKDDQLKIRTKTDIRDRRIEKSRGCHLYTISKGGDGHLRLAVAVGRKMLTFQWKYSAAWTSWCSNNETETADGFIFLRVNYPQKHVIRTPKNNFRFRLLKEITLHDIPTIMTILEGPASTNSGCLTCVGFK